MNDTWISPRICIINDSILLNVPFWQYGNCVGFTRDRWPFQIDTFLCDSLVSRHYRSWIFITPVSSARQAKSQFFPRRNSFYPENSDQSGCDRPPAQYVNARQLISNSRTNGLASSMLPSLSLLSASAESLTLLPLDKNRVLLMSNRMIIIQFVWLLKGYSSFPFRY